MVLKSPRHVTIVYGQNKFTSKFIGVNHGYEKQEVDQEAVLARYLLPEKPFTLIRFDEENEFIDSTDGHNDW